MQMENRICFLLDLDVTVSFGKTFLFCDVFCHFNFIFDFFILLLNGRQVCEIDILILARFPLILSLAPPDLIELKQFVYLLF